MRRFSVRICLIAALAFASAGGARAEEAGGHKDDHKHAPAKFIAIDHEHKETKYDLSIPEDKKKLIDALPHIHKLKADLPPEIIPKRWDTGVWSVLIFLALFLLLGKFAWKPMIAGLRKREENIRSAQEQAEKARADAMALQSQLDAKMRSAGADIAKLMDEARSDAQALKTQMVADAKAEIQADRDRLLREVTTAKDQALQQIWQQSVGLAALMSSKAVRRGMSEDDHRRLLDESLAELKQAGGEFGKRVH
jgi:F-type H+-transporting ATPase subunit b